MNDPAYGVMVVGLWIAAVLFFVWTVCRRDQTGLDGVCDSRVINTATIYKQTTKLDHHAKDLYLG